MELRLICLAIFALAVSQCSVSGHAVQRRQAVDDANYDDPFVADEASDDLTQNDAEPENSNDSKPVKPPAVILTKPTTFEVVVGKDLLLPCEVSPSMGTVVQWQKNHTIIAIGNFRVFHDTRYSIEPNTTSLQITNVKLNDTGVVTCNIMQKGNLVAINHTIIVLEPPKIITTSATENGRVSEDNGLTLACNISGVPTPTVMWSFTTDENKSNQRLTEKDGDFTVDNNVYSIYMKKVRLDQAGKYYCYAINSCGHDQGEIEVIVNPKPRVHVPRAVINSDVNVEAILECSAHEAQTAHIRWYKDGVLIEDRSSQYTISTSGSHSNLTVVPTTDNDFGTFTCEAENAYGKHNRSIDLVQRPVIEKLMSDGPKMIWTVHSHQPLEEIEVQLRNYTGNGDWKTFSVPVPQGNGHKYEVTYVLENTDIEAGKYEAVIKAKNTKSWGSSGDPAMVEIEEPTPLIVQHASVFRTNSAHSIRSTAVVSTTLMYLLVRMM